MKKLSLLYILFATVLFAGTGCLKDKDFEEQRYGLQIAEVKAVAFPQTSKSPVMVGITGQEAPLTVDGPYITIEGIGGAASDITVKLEFDDALVTAKGLTPLPTGSYSLNKTDAVIKAGDSAVSDLKLTVNNSIALDPNKKYGVGIKMTAVNGAYQIAKNMSTVVIGFTIKNKYDGVYRLQGYHNRTPYTFPYDTEIHLVTNGPSEVYFYWPEVKSIGHPIGTGPSSTSWYGAAIAPSIVFNPTTNKVVDVYNLTTGTVITMFTGAGSRESKWDPATRSITVDWNYANNPLRAFFDDLTYIGPRP